MRKPLTTLCILIFMTIQLFGQITDSTLLKKFFHDSKSEKYIVSEQQEKAKPYYEKGYNLIAIQRYSDAIEPLKKAVDIDSTGNCGAGINGFAYYLLSHAYGEIGDYKNARLYMDKARFYLEKPGLLIAKGIINPTLELNGQRS